VPRQNIEGRLYWITFVYNQTKCVLNGSDLGKGYSAIALQSCIGVKVSEVTKKDLTQTDETTGTSSGSFQKNLHAQSHKEQSLNKTRQNENLLEQLAITQRTK
jgi:hypothetical protein